MNKEFVILLGVILTVFQYTYGYKIWKETNARLAALENRPAQVLFVETHDEVR